MKNTKLLCLLVLFSCTVIYRSIYAQGLITVVPAQNDFCSGSAFVSISINNPDPNYDYYWYEEDYSNFSQVGYSTHLLIASGVGFINYATQYCNRVNIVATEINTGFQYLYDNFVIGTNQTPFPGNKIPYYEDNTGCRRFLIPNFFYGNIFNVPGRTGNWYKDGVVYPTNYNELTNPDKGKYYYKLTLACGTILTTDTINITTTLPAAPVVSAMGSTIICNGDTAKLSVNGTWPNYAWLRNGSLIANSNQNIFNATLAGTYTMQYLNASGCYVTSSNSIVVTVQTGPKITALDTIGCTGDSILLSCNTASSYQWKKNNVNIANATQQNFLVKSAGNYSVVTSGLQCNVSKPVAINYFAKPTIAISPTGTLNLCSGNGLDFTANATNTIIYNWYKGNVLYNTSSSNTLFVPVSGSYYCIATSNQGCTAKSNTTVLIAKSSATLPVISIALQPTAAGFDAYVEKSQPNTNYGNSTALIALNYVTGNPLYRALLKFDLSSIPSNAPILAAKLSLYSDSVSTYGTIHKSFYIRQITQPWNEQTVTWNTQPTFTELNRIAIADGVSPFQDITNIAVQNTVKQWSQHPTDNNGWVLTRQTEAGNPAGFVHFASSDFGVASRRPKLVIQYAYAKIDTGSATTFCNGDSVKFTTNSGAYTYQWYNGNAAINGAVTSTYTAKVAGNYSVKVTNSNGCSVVSSQKNVVVKTNPAITITPLGNTTFCNGDSVKLQSNGVGTYQWRRNNNIIANASAQSYTAKTAGAYTVRVTKTNGCSRNSAAVQITVPCKLPSMLHAEDNSLINIYPNPCTDLINIESNVACEKLSVVDFSGRIIIGQEFSNLINLEHLKAGVYFLNLFDSDGNTIYREKIIKVN
jgi:hypothetical protein